MKLILLSSLALLAASSIAQNVNIPDANFKAYLVGNSSINTNMDTEIQVSEAQAFTGQIMCDNLNISDLTGIEEFTSITQLRCQNNQLTSLNISQNTSLTILLCYSNQLSSLDVSQNSLLTDVSAGFNQLTNVILGSSNNLINLNVIDNNLTSLDVSQCSALQELYCYNNNLSTLDVSQNLNLIDLRCQGQQISSLNVNSNLALEILICAQNTLSSLDVSNCTNLQELNCQSNSLSTLDLSSNLNLAELKCNLNSLTTLDLSNNSSLFRIECATNLLTSLNVANGNNSNVIFFTAQQNPNLSCIEVDDSTYSASNWSNIDLASSFSEDCSGGSVGVIELDNSNIKLYPNPASNQITIDGNIISVKIYDINGSLVQSETTNRFSISNLEAGMYVAVVLTKDGIKRAQFVKQ